MKVFIRATIPPELQQKWLQHVRDFDAANPGCHFEVMVDAKLTFSQIFERKKQ